MTSQAKGVLLVEDDSRTLGDVEQYLREQGWRVFPCERPSEVRKTVKDWLAEVQVAVIDHRFTADSETGQELGAWIKTESHGRISTILWTAQGDESLATSAIQGGFDDYWSKVTKSLLGMLHGCEVWRGVSETRRARAEAEARAEQLEHELAARQIDNVGGSPAVILDERLRRTVIDIRRTVGPSLMPVLVVGETGTGKESIAREVHQASGLPPANFRAVNCAAFTETLLMSELFGHVKGSFTGADSHRLGVILEAAGVRAKEQDSTLRTTVRAMMQELWDVTGKDRVQFLREFMSTRRETVDTFYDRVVQVAAMIEKIERVSSSSSFISWLELCGNVVEPDAEHGRFTFPALGTSTRGISGTLFLDEVADLSKDAQAALLRFLDGNGIRPVGYSGAVLVPSIRVIAATNRTNVLFGNRLQTDSFRTDLLWRLAGWIIEIPPLHERTPDAVGAAIHRAKSYGSRATEGWKTKTFGLTAEAQAKLTTLVNSRRFSGEAATESGNFRNLNWLIDRACWITAVRDDSASEIDTDALEQAAAVTVRSDDQPASVEETDTPQPVETQSRIQTSDPPPDSAVLLGSILTDLAGARPIDLREYDDQDRNLDKQLVQRLGRYFSGVSKDVLRSCEIRAWFNIPHTVLSEKHAGLPMGALARWKSLFFISCLEFCGRHDGGHFEWRTAETEFGAKREPFRKEIGLLFLHHGLRINFPSAKTSRPLRDLAYFVLGREGDARIEVTDRAKAAAFSAHLKLLAGTVNLTA